MQQVHSAMQKLFLHSCFALQCDDATHPLFNQVNTNKSKLHTDPCWLLSIFPGLGSSGIRLAGFTSHRIASCLAWPFNLSSRNFLLRLGVGSCVFRLRFNCYWYIQPAQSLVPLLAKKSMMNPSGMSTKWTSSRLRHFLHPARILQWTNAKKNECAVVIVCDASLEWQKRELLWCWSPWKQKQLHEYHCRIEFICPTQRGHQLWGRLWPPSVSFLLKRCGGSEG